MKKLMIWTIACLLASCDFSMEGDDAAVEAAVRWGECYFNCDLHSAETYCTLESGRWLSFAASNITQQMLDLLHQQESGAEVAFNDYFLEANDTLRIVELEVRNYLQADAIGDVPHISDKGIFHVTVVKRDEKWLVRMEGLPRNEKPYPD